MSEYEIVTAYRAIRAKVTDPLVDWRDPRQTLIAGHQARDAEVEALLKTIEFSGDLLLKFPSARPIPCSERLPGSEPGCNSSADVAVWCDEEWIIASYSYSAQAWDTELGWIKKPVTHWLSLPAPVEAP